MSAPRQTCQAFTLLELLLALGLLSLITVVTYVSFSVVTQSWQRGVSMTDKLHHGDFVVEQLVMGLRSAYYPVGGGNGDYGMWVKEGGDGPNADDELSWVKLGSALVGRDQAHAGGPHRVKVTLEPDDKGNRVLAVRSWGLLSQVEDFDADKLPAQYLSPKVTGLSYRFQDPEEDEEEDEIVWTDEWKETNRIPMTVEITVYMEPLEKGGDPVTLKRVVSLPCGPLAWASGAGTVAPPTGGETPATGEGSPTAPEATDRPGAPGLSTPPPPDGLPPGLSVPPPPSVPPGTRPGAPPGLPPGGFPSIPPPPSGRPP